MSETSSAFVSLSADVVAAYVSNNSVPQADLPSLIASIHTALRDAANGKQQAEKVVLEPPDSVKKSITSNHLISMEDGRPYKSLKRHLTARGLTPAQYREKWSLADKEGQEGWEEGHGISCRCAGEKARCCWDFFNWDGGRQRECLGQHKAN